MANQQPQGDHMKKLAIITGASRGIGYAIAKYLASRGMDLILIAQHIDGLSRAKQSIMDAHPECRVHVAPVDMEDVASVDSSITRILEDFPIVSILINAAGVLKLGASEMPTAHLLELLTVNLTSTLVISNKVAEQMKSARAGHIFTIASLAGIESQGKLAAYASSKAGLISYSQSLYSDLLVHNVNVTCLCPSVVNTDMTNDGRIKNEEKFRCPRSSRPYTLCFRWANMSLFLDWTCIAKLWMRRNLA